MPIGFKNESWQEDEHDAAGNVVVPSSVPDASACDDPIADYVAQTDAIIARYAEQGDEEGVALLREQQRRFVAGAPAMAAAKAEGRELDFGTVAAFFTPAARARLRDAMNEFLNDVADDPGALDELGLTDLRIQTEDRVAQLETMGEEEPVHAQ